MKYKWILFDADETLFHFDAFAGLKLMFSRLGIDFTSLDYEKYQQVNLSLWVEYQNGVISAETLQHTRFENWAKKLSLTTKKLNSEFLHAMAEICTLLPGAKELIEALAGKVKLGIITNGFTQLQTVRLQKTGLHDAFSLLVISEQVGVAKPDIKIFEHTFALMEHPDKQHVLMVGDNPHSDIQGGINAGIDTCWLNVNAKEKPAGINPNYQVSSLTELHNLLIADKGK